MPCHEDRDREDEDALIQRAAEALGVTFDAFVEWAAESAARAAVGVKRTESGFRRKAV